MPSVLLSPNENVDAYLSFAARAEVERPDIPVSRLHQRWLELVARAKSIDADGSGFAIWLRKLSLDQKNLTAVQVANLKGAYIEKLAAGARRGRQARRPTQQIRSSGSFERAEDIEDYIDDQSGGQFEEMTIAEELREKAADLRQCADELDDLADSMDGGADDSGDQDDQDGPSWEGNS